jgi:hypothetical protein
MAAGLTPESWALLALCGVLLSFGSSPLTIEPGLVLMPMLAVLLPRMGVPAGAAIHTAIATAIALLVPLSISRLGLLRQAERQRIVHLAPATLAGAFFGGSVLPSLPGSFLMIGFAILAGITLTHRRRKISITLAITPPMRAPGSSAAILKSAAFCLFGIGLPLCEGRTAEKAGFALILSTGAVAALLQAPSACKGCTGFVFMPALIAIAAGAVLTAPLWTATFGESSEPRLRPVVVLAAVTVLLAAPFGAPDTGKTALAALAPGLCPARPAPAITLAQFYRDPLPALVQRFGPRRGFSPVKTGKPKPSIFFAVARGAAANLQNLQTSGWITVIESHPPQKAERRKIKRATRIEGP